MRIKDLRLQDFRNYRDQTFVFNEDKVFIFGPNGKGKTNILEAISVLSMGKSWRETMGRDLILNGEVSAKIEAVSESGLSRVQTQDQLSAIIEPKKRSFYLEGKRLTTKDWIGKVPTLLFCPELLRLFSGGKKDRLAFLDRFIAQVDPTFRAHLLKAVKAHKQKTALLKQLEEASPEQWTSQIAPWNKILSETVPVIWDVRAQMLAKWLQPLQNAYQAIASTKEAVGLEFKPSEDFVWDSQSCLAWLDSQANRERASRRNSLSPMRDDVAFYLRDRLVCENASRGEERSMMLALLSAQKEILIDQYDLSPILLLDDVFSELDDDRQAHLEKLCEGVQTFFTTTHESHVSGFKAKVQKINL